MLFAATPPAVANVPPTIKSPFGKATTLAALPSRPEPNGDENPVAGSHVTMPPTRRLPAVVNPPAINVVAGRGPGPSGSQGMQTATLPFVPGTPSPGCHCNAH